jgi:hypothetical protein
MRVTMLLADAAQVVGGKLYILGGGWSITGPAPTPMAVAMKFDVPWNDANRRIPLELSLVDEDSRPAIVPTPTGERPVVLSAEIEVGRPAGLRPGTPLDAAMAVNIGPLPLQADTGYVWKVKVDGKEKEDWQLSFRTRPAGARQDRPPAHP